MATSTHSVDLESKTRKVLRVVLKRYRVEDRTSLLEWDRLSFARGLPVPSPEPLALDASGQWFGTPALVMSRLPGRACVLPKRLDPWLEQMATTLVNIQDRPMSGTPAALRRPHLVDNWKPPSDLRRSDIVKRAIVSVRRNLAEALEAGRAIGHGDFHPGNLLWSRERLTGVIDWSSARIGPRAYEVAYCRADLTVLIGADAAERFRQVYERVWGQSLGNDLWVWDLICALDAMKWGHLWAVAYREQGRTDLTARHVWPRAAALARNALANL
ncbi:MAG: aminoglycoside phosphotransferase family protein [Actinobacteria bacterium]|nr:aminoglycoside phosphotransferase family protein [Actinomycetota bacterium]